MGEQRGSLGLTGELTMRVGEWQLFVAALIDGGKGMGQHLEVVTEGDTDIIRELAQRQLVQEKKGKL